MYKYLICILISFSFLSCEEVEKNFDYIQVTVTGSVVAVRLEDNTLIMDEFVSAIPVDMALVKAGGERFQEIGTTGNDGTTSITTVFNLYKEQPIEFIARLVNHPEQIKSQKLTWEEALEVSTGDGTGSPRTASYKFVLYFGIP